MLLAGAGGEQDDQRENYIKSNLFHAVEFGV
jgi:hypothetical protein